MSPGLDCKCKQSSILNRLHPAFSKVVCNLVKLSAIAKDREYFFQNSDFSE